MSSRSSIASLEKTRNNSFSSEGVCRIIESCGKNGVLEAHFGDISVFFTENRQMKVLESRKPLPQDTLSQSHIGVPRDAFDPGFPRTEHQKDNLLEEETKLKQAQFDELIFTDPEMADRIAMQNLTKDLEEDIDDDGEI